MHARHAPFRWATQPWSSLFILMGHLCRQELQLRNGDPCVSGLLAPQVSGTQVTDSEGFLLGKKQMCVSRARHGCGV